ncbi:unnamed protein product [Arabis nemorensis]|uniref:Uncharacterized protein n=1 Tax=Arabis nemorensis TaxID=586526 RepID=A0A565BXB0_9BRAS|nr:unnamed protein product [Arabis nemorensis]
MSLNLLEQTRLNHEEIERLERLVVKDLKTEPKSSRDRLVQGHRVRNVIESIMLNTKKLVEIYEDKDGSMEDEISRAVDDQTNLFYDRLREIREYHRNYRSSSVVDDFEGDFKPVISFSGEEGYGRYLDLHDFYNQYVNFVHQKDRKLKFSNQYRKYMDGLLDYLINFIKRTGPLQDLGRIFAKVETDFEEQYAQGKTQGNDNVIDLDYYTPVEELIDLGPEKLKEALGSLGMKVGGTVKQRAERLFLTKHTPLEKLDKKHFARHESESGAKKIALTEAKVKKLCILLSETIKRTKENIEKK